MITGHHFFKSAVVAFAAFRHQFNSKLALSLALFAVLAASAAAQTTPLKTFPIRGGSQPFAITMGEDGNFWFTLSNSSKVARITPRGSINYFRTPSLSNPAFITPGPDGNIWFGEGSTGKIASVTPDGIITEYQFSFFGVSVGITTGSDGNIWFTDQTDHAVWRYELSSGRFTEFRTPTPNSFPGDITTGSDGNIWFTEQAVDKFGRITPQGVITEFTGVSAPTSIAAGPDGNLWIASAFTPQVARVTPALAITIFPTPATPTMIRPGNANNLLFTEFSANKIASITTNGVVTESPEFVNSAPEGIIAGVASRVWFLGVGTNRVYETVIPR
ncbi:MAG: Virginiamycin B lyase [Verrucomicrobia bacterium]|nr:MAG: Virginiamycin B lyase [Verrucomicrobiota bacterium]